jgi:hypothetical protein
MNGKLKIILKIEGVSSDGKANCLFVGEREVGGG